MNSRVGFNRLGRKASHRKALSRNMVISLFEHERIRTTKAKALEVRKVAEKMITRAREDSVHNRRVIAKNIGNKAVLNKLFTDVAPRFTGRPGGYTRILKLGQRQGDAAEMVILELVVRDSAEPAQSSPQKKGASKKSEKTSLPQEKGEAIPKEATSSKETEPKETAASKKAAPKKTVEKQDPADNGVGEG